MNPIKHVAIIMDGNGRWGIKNKGSRNSGHRAGLKTVELVIEEKDEIEDDPGVYEDLGQESIKIDTEAVRKKFLEK